MIDEKVAKALNEVARQLDASHEVEVVLSTIVTAARNSLPEVDHAGVSLAHGDGRVAQTGNIKLRDLATDLVKERSANRQENSGYGSAIGTEARR